MTDTDAAAARGRFDQVWVARREYWSSKTSRTSPALIKHALERAGDGAGRDRRQRRCRAARGHATPPDLVILDLNLPVLSGTEVCRILRGRPATAGVPIIMLTARTSEADRVAGLDLGRRRLRHQAVQPARACRARARGAAPAAGGCTGATVYQGTHLTADFDAVAIAVDGAAVRLTRREFELLRFLVENRNRVLSRDRLLERVWGYDRFIETRSVDVHVGRLRAKLGAAGQQIETVVGLGYRFVE